MANLKFDLKAGGRLLMVNYQDIIKNFVAKNHLVPVNTAEMKTAKAIGNTEWLPIYLKYGGHINPHFHVGSDAYILDDQQWLDFSKILITQFQKKLENMKGITFHDALNISNVIDAHEI
jgi:hypothetical protein